MFYNFNYYKSHHTCISVPRSPVNTTAENKTCNSVSLSWQPPANNGGSSIEGYQIAIPKAPEGFELVRTTSTTTVIIGLQPNTYYTIHIRATNAFGLSPPAVVNISTEELRELTGLLLIIYTKASA